MPRVHASVEDQEFAQKLNHLFRVCHPPDRGPYTLREVADSVTAAGTPLSFSYLSQLRSGAKGRPSAAHAAALARYFDVDVTYFFGEKAQVEQIKVSLAFQALMQRPHLQTIVTELTDMPADGVWAVAGFIAHLKGAPPRGAKTWGAHHSELLELFQSSDLDGR
ncbi:MAG TPA: hypothetical protein VHN80_12075 [Kineosporiaceae bacterium]|nr:hypothetical protein [Kineosporiaceae bacterium]